MGFRELYLWMCHRLYNEAAWGYDAAAALVSLGRWDDWRRQALVHLPEHGPVLEIGFGTGELLPELAARAEQVYGLEPSPAMQAITRRKLRRRGLEGCIPRVRGQAQQLPFRNGSLAAIVATFPAEYVFQPAVAAEFARVLRGPAGAEDAGRLIIGPLAITIDDPRLSRLTPFFYGAPPEEYLARWRAVLEGAGLQWRTVTRAGRGVHVTMLVATRGG